MTLAIGLSARGSISAGCSSRPAGLMIATGLAFALVEHLRGVLLVAFVGTINPSSGGVSIFVPLEHTLLARSARIRTARGCSRATA